jgi:hypothetical protein
MPPVGFEPTIPVSERPQTHVLDRASTEIGLKYITDGNIEGRIEMTGRRGRRGKQLLDDLKEKRRYWKLKKGSTRSHSMGYSLWKSLRTCRKADYKMNE